MRETKTLYVFSAQGNFVTYTTGGMAEAVMGDFSFCGVAEPTSIQYFAMANE